MRIIGDVIARGRRHAPTDHPEPQQRDLEILRDLWRYRYLTTRMIAEKWWPGCHLTRAQVRLRRLHDAGWVDRLRPRLNRGSHEWIYHLARPGFGLGQRYLRDRDDPYIPREAKWHQRDAIDLDYVWHDLEVNQWMRAYAELLGDQLEDWLGPAEARTHVASRFDPTLRRHRAPTTDQLAPSRGWVRDLRSGEDVRPVFPDAAAVLQPDDGRLPAEVLVEYDRTGRATKNIEKLRRYDTLLCCGWKAVDRLRRQAPRAAVQPSLVIVFVCQPGTLESFIRVADAEVAGALGFYVRPGHQVHPGREAILFCEAKDLHGSVDAFRLPELPPGRRTADRCDPRVGVLPGSHPRCTELDTRLPWDI